VCVCVCVCVAVGVPSVDITAGMWCCNGVLQALLHRNSTGEGCHFEVSMLDCAGELMGYAFQFSQYVLFPYSHTHSHLHSRPSTLAIV